MYLPQYQSVATRKDHESHNLTTFDTHCLHTLAGDLVRPGVWSAERGRSLDGLVDTTVRGGSAWSVAAGGAGCYMQGGPARLAAAVRVEIPGS
jgi:hypothetical protein